MRRTPWQVLYCNPDRLLAEFSLAFAHGDARTVAKMFILVTKKAIAIKSTPPVHNREQPLIRPRGFQEPFPSLG